MDLFSEVILEASFNGIAFPVSQEESSPATWDSVKHTAYRRDGADIEPTGLQPRHGTMDCPFFNDLDPGLFPDRHDQLIDAVRRNPISVLIHPVEGRLTALIDSIQRTTSGQERDGVRLKIQWTEHLASDINLQRNTEELRDAPEAAMQQAATADAEMASAAPDGGFANLLDTVGTELEKLESGLSAVSDIEASLRTMTSAVEGNLSLPVFAGVSAHNAVVSLEALRSTIVRLRARYLPDESRMRQYVVPVTMSDSDVSLHVYGDANHADKIREANALPDYLFIPKGSVLTILPLV